MRGGATGSSEALGAPRWSKPPGPPSSHWGPHIAIAARQSETHQELSGVESAPPDAHLRGPYPHALLNTGFADAHAWRFVTGGTEGGSPVAVWARPRFALVAGEGATPLSRLLLLADAGNGLSRLLDVDTWWFINTELTVHLHREPAGDWFLLAARSIVEPTGRGMTETELFDRDGRVGRAAQALVVGPR